MKDAEYYGAVSLLAQGISPTEVAEEMNISPSKVIRWNTEYNKAKDNGTLDKLLDMDELVIRTAAAITDVPVGDEAKALAKVQGIQRLESATQNTALNLVTRINTMAMGVAGSEELVILVDALCKLQTAFFNKNVTQVNVQNNLSAGNGGAYRSFLSDAPGE